MDLMEKRHFDTTRGMHYSYYSSKPTTAPDASNKPVLLLLHGFPDGAGLWQFIIPGLQRATKLPILAPDLLGYGESSKSIAPADHTPELVSRDIMEILAHERLDSRSIIPIGHDWGSIFAQRLYLLYPDRCAGLVTLSVAYSAPTGEAMDLAALNTMSMRTWGYSLYAYWDLFTAPDGPALIEHHLDNMWNVMHADDDTWMMRHWCEHGAMREYLETNREGTTLKSYARDGRLRDEWITMIKAGGLTSPLCPYRMMKENHGLETEKRLPTKVEKPYLFIGSTADNVCRKDMIEQPIQQGLLSDVTVKVVDACHWIPYEKPDETVLAIVEWLKKKSLA